MKKILLTLLLLSVSSVSIAYEEGDNICINKWDNGKGYCGIVERVTSRKYKIEITSETCGYGGCAPTACSGGKLVGIAVFGGYGLREGDSVWAEKWCAN